MAHVEPRLDQCDLVGSAQYVMSLLNYLFVCQVTELVLKGFRVSALVAFDDKIKERKTWMLKQYLVWDWTKPQTERFKEKLKT